MNPNSLDRICDALPIFPLPRTVLMPGELLPLHVFEPRYLALVQHCLDHESLMGIATLRPGYEEDYDGAPPIHPEVGIGRVVKHQILPDGRCNIVLEAVGKMSVTGELEGDAVFRTVRGTPLEDDRSGIDAPLQRLRMLVLQLGQVSTEAAHEAQALVELDGVEMVDTLARKLVVDPDDRRTYLATQLVTERISEVGSRLARFLAVMVPAADA